QGTARRARRGALIFPGCSPAARYLRADVDRDAAAELVPGDGQAVGRAAEEEEAEHGGHVADVDGPVALPVEERPVRGIRRRSVPAGEAFRYALEEGSDEGDRIREVEGAAPVGVAGELHRRRPLHQR